MAFAIDPILANILFTLNLFAHGRRSSSSAPFESPNTVTESPTVSVLLPFYKESEFSVERTVESIERQTYPAEKLEIVYILEPDDNVTRIPTHQNKQIPRVIVRTDGRVHLKAHALNKGLEVAKGDIIVVYDADDTIDPDQIGKGVSLMEEKGYDVLQPIVVRKSGRSAITKLFGVDSFVWNRKFLPYFQRSVGVFPLSGEGLFNRRAVLQEIGGFPEVLTEDAYLGIQLAERGKRFGLLDSTVTEEPPKNWASHFRQRVRWFRGYLSCLGKLVKSKLPIKTKLIFSTAFFAPITCAASLISLIFFATFWASWALNPASIAAPWMRNFLYTSGIFYWSAFLAYLGNILVIFSQAEALVDTKYERYAPLAILSPLYWLFLGFAAFASFFRGTRVFGRTERQ